MKISYSRITFILVLLYIFLCISHYFAQRPLWNDEMAVKLSVVGLKPAALFNQRLLNDQVFPRVYLFIVQTVSKTFDYHLLSLRFCSFVAMLGAFGIWLKIAKYEFRDPKLYCLFVLSWTASIPMVYYSAELKQYSMDVLAAAIYILFLLKQQDMKGKSVYLWTLACLPVLGLFSYPAHLLSLIPLYNCILNAKEDRAQRKPLCIYVCALGLFGALSYNFDIRLPAYSITQMGGASGFADYFISFETVGEFFRSLGEGICSLFCRSSKIYKVNNACIYRFCDDSVI